MKRQVYFPSRQPEQPDWLLNFSKKLASYAASLSLDPGVVTAGQNDALYLAYGLGVWIKNVRDYAPSCTSSLEVLMTGSGAAPFAMPVCTAPALPVGVVAVPPGALTRVFKLVQVIKNSPGYTEAIGIDMGIVGSAVIVPNLTPAPVALKVTVVPGPNGERASIAYIKNGHYGVLIQSRRGGGAFEDIGNSNKSPFIDSRPLLVAGVPEIREYRACYVDDSQPSGDWSDVAKVTLAP